jgi:glycosyltransferase involved in cell wall biosynthesis
MKIAILTPTFYYHSGIDRVVQQQAEDYTKKGDEVTVFALDSTIKTIRYNIVTIGMPKNIILQRIYRLLFFLDITKLGAYKKLKGFDLIISHFYPMNWLAYKAKKKFNILYVYWDHGINTTGLLNNIPQKVYMYIFRVINNFTLRNIDEAVSVSRYLSKVLDTESNIKSRVVYNKIDISRFNVNVNGQKIIKKYNLDGNRVILYVGRIAPHKGIHLLLKVFDIIKTQIPNSKLIVAGNPNYKGYFKRLKKQSVKDAIFTGFVPDDELPSYYGACDLYVSCSQWEGFDLPAAEAQACGKPVIAFDIGSHPEIIKNGKLIKNLDVEEFAQKAIEYLKK